MVSRREKNKFDKYNRLISSAYELFLSQGVFKTTIDDIVKNADVAKGTFYLYFQNKDEITKEVAFVKASEIIKAATAFAEKEINRDIPDRETYKKAMLSMSGYIISFFEKNSEILEILYKNLSSGLFERLEKSSDISSSINGFIVASGKDKEQMEKRIYITIEMIGSVCYNAIIMQNPFSMEEIKTELLNIISDIID